MERAAPWSLYGPAAGGWENATLERFLKALAAYANEADERVIERGAHAPHYYLTRSLTRALDRDGYLGGWMEPHIVLLNGPAGVGKSTVARQLTTLYPGTVCISGDALRAFTSADPTSARTLLGPGSTYRAAAALAGTYLGMGARRVVFEYVFENPAHVEHFRRSAPAGVPLYLITLWAPLAVVTAREALRHRERAPLGPQLETCYHAMEPHVARLGMVVPTEGRTVEQVAHYIDAQLRGRATDRQASL